MTCAYQIVLNETRAFSPAEKVNWQNVFIALAADLNDVRAKFNLVQQELNAGGAVGSTNYPNGTMQINANQFLPLA